MSVTFEEALDLVESRLSSIRAEVPQRHFDPTRPAEVEINEFYFNGRTIDRVMVVLRATGCEHYGTKKGCSMCAHFDGTTLIPVSAEQYVKQWESVVDGSSIDEGARAGFDINRFPVLCLYNLGSFINPKEVPPEAIREIFRSIGKFHGIQKVIIESRAEYVTDDNLRPIRDVYNGLVEVGVGLESSNHIVRELCHHKNMPDLVVFDNAIRTLHRNGFRALAYVNQKPPFLTEREAVEDAVRTSIHAYDSGVDAVSIEPTSLQAHSLTDQLHTIGLYRVPWLWSVIEVVKGIYDHYGHDGVPDLRLGGYFDEEVLSGSQGVAPGVERNELFPRMTSGNCNICDPRIVQAIKDFNKTYDPRVLLAQEPCEYCYPTWEASMGVTDSRSIPQRIYDTLKPIEETYGKWRR